MMLIVVGLGSKKDSSKDDDPRRRRGVGVSPLQLHS